MAPFRPAPAQGGHERARLALAFLLVALAGWIDGVAFVRWHELYPSFMSGNTVELSASPARDGGARSLEVGRALLLFVCGVVAGEWIGGASGRWRGPAVVSVEAGLLWLAAASALAGWGDAATASVAGLAMGVQTAAIHEADGVSVALTYVTGTLVNAGRGIAAALRGAEPWSGVLPFAGLWLSLLGGAAAGSLAARAGLDLALVAAAAAASVLAAVAGGLAARRACPPGRS